MEDSFIFRLKDHIPSIPNASRDNIEVDPVEEITCEDEESIVPSVLCTKERFIRDSCELELSEHELILA